MITQPKVLAIDYGGPLATGYVHDLGAGRPVDADAIPALHALTEQYRLILSSNVRPGTSRRLELRRSGVKGLFHAIVESDQVMFKPMRDFYRHLIREAGCRPEEIMHVGNRLDNDVLIPVATGMSAAYVCPYATPGEWLPGRVVHIRRFAHLPGALSRLDQWPVGPDDKGGYPSMREITPARRSTALNVGGMV